jgi:hypothetical protein
MSKLNRLINSEKQSAVTHSTLSSKCGKYLEENSLIAAFMEGKYTHEKLLLRFFLLEKYEFPIYHPTYTLLLLLVPYSIERWQS